MGDNIVPLRPGIIGDGAALDPDQILEAAKGEFLQLVIIGFDKNGEIDMRSSHGSRDALWIIERGRLHLLTETC